MPTSAQKIKDSVSGAPAGALAGALIGYLTAKSLNYDKHLPVISFIIVGTIIGSAIGYKVKNI